MFRHMDASNEARRQDRESVKSVCVCFQHNHRSLGNDKNTRERKRRREKDTEKAAMCVQGLFLHMCLGYNTVLTDRSLNIGEV